MSKAEPNSQTNSSKKAPWYRWLFLDVAKVLGWPSFTLFTRTKKYYETKPFSLSGKAILMPSHGSLLEPLVLVFAFFRRRLRIVAMKELFVSKPFLGWLLKQFGCVCIERDQASLSSINEMVQILNEDGVVGIFPEGKISTTEEILPFKPGVIMVALKTGAPIIPIYIKRDHNLLHRRVLVIGDPVYLKDYISKPIPSCLEITALTEMLQKKMEALKQILLLVEPEPPINPSNTNEHSL